MQIADANGLRRRLLLAGATVSLALAIWTMHFVGMLAVRQTFQVDYLVLPTLLSFLVCAIVVGAAVYATTSGPLTLLRLTLSACLMGGGIFTMHYVGMSALDASAYTIYDPVYVAASMAIAIAASGLALWLASGRGGRAAAHSVGDGFRLRDIRHALHGDGRCDAVCFRTGVVRRAGVFDRSLGHHRRDRRVLYFRNFFPAAVARFQPATATGHGGGCAGAEHSRGNTGFTRAGRRSRIRPRHLFAAR